MYLFTFGLIWYFLLKFIILNISPLLGRGGWPSPELASYWRAALYLFPSLSMVISANQTCSDRTRGTLRFLLLRASRDSIYFGRYLAQLLLQMCLIVATLASVLIAALMKDSSLLIDGFESAVIIACNLFIVLIPITAMMALLSITVKSTRQAIVLAMLIWVLASALIKLVSQYFPLFEVFEFIIPGRQLSDLSDLSMMGTFSLAHVPILQGVVLLVAGRLVMQRAVL